MCKQIPRDWHENRKRQRMTRFELQEFQIKESTFALEPYLCSQFPVHVIATGVDGRNILEDHPSLKWNGLQRIIDVVAAISKITRRPSGTEIIISKNAKVVEYEERLQDLCGAGNTLEINFVISRTEYTPE